MSTIVIIDTGTANLASMCAAFARIGRPARVTGDTAVIRHAELLVLPGVGSFESGMTRVNALGIADELERRVASDRPLLAVCLGLQLLCQASEESPGVAGLALLDGTVARFRDAPLVPQLGWNTVMPDTCDLIEEGYAYYANSYRLGEPPDGWQCAFTEHGERFVAAIERGSVLGCQFHPELSGPWGHSLIRRWVAKGSASC
jgi:imidazole glycerol phosphate synthase glutamine amidotransferase subunit